MRRPRGASGAGTASSGLGRQKIFEVRKIYNDVTFIDEFMTEEFCERQKLYVYGYDARTGRYVIVEPRLAQGEGAAALPAHQPGPAHHPRRSTPTTRTAASCT